MSDLLGFVTSAYLACGYMIRDAKVKQCDEFDVGELTLRMHPLMNGPR